MVRYELNQPIEENAACGGTHRLFGLTWAYFRHLERGGKTVGVWKDVDATLRKTVQEEGGKSVDQANEYVEKLKSDKRYKRDVY